MASKVMLEKQQGQSKSNRKYLLAAIAVGVLAYVDVIKGLFDDWINNPDYSHGLLVLAAIMGFVWWKRDELRAAPDQPSTQGLWLLGFSQLLHLVGVLGAEFFLQRASMVLAIIGVILYLRGFVLLKKLAVCILLLQLTIPIPAVIFAQLTAPLQRVSSQLAELLLNAVSVPVYRDGNVIEIAGHVLNVSEACSGIRSEMSLIALAVIFAYFLPNPLWVKSALVLSAIPVGVVANAFRVAATGLIAQHFGRSAATGASHLFEGWLLFLVAFGLLMSEFIIVQKVFEKASAK